MKFASSVSVTLLAALSVVSATPVERSTQDSWSPPIIFPTKGTELKVGEKYTFVWPVHNSLQFDDVVDNDLQGH